MSAVVGGICMVVLEVGGLVRRSTDRQLVCVLLCPGLSGMCFACSI